MSIKENGCPCGRNHINPIDKILTGNGAIRTLPDTVKQYGAKKVFVLSDKNTFSAAGEQVLSVLDYGGIDYISFSLDSDFPEPDEKSVGSAVMHFDNSCQAVVGVGSGVINDICKIISSVSHRPYIIVATAPSMDGYASSTSSMTRGGLKISLPSTTPNAIIGDTDILKNAPKKMLTAGLGDMLAKYVSICEWRISNIITGEYFCEEIAALIRSALKECTDNAAALMSRDEKAVEAVFNGLVTGGIAMTYAGVSRPASGIEHYLSHIWDMRAAEFKTKAELHGIQCAVGTLISVRLYEKIKLVIPNREKAVAYVNNFDAESWNNSLLDFLGNSASQMIELEKREKKYDKDGHRKRLETIIQNWNKIIEIINEELPSCNDILKILRLIEAPQTLEEIGLSSDILPMTFKSAKDIRDKYVLPRLAWDLGIIDEIVQSI